MPIEVNDDNFDAKVMKGKAIVDFWAEWCGPCRILGPRFEELSKEMKEIKFCKLDVDSNPETAGKYGVRSIPSLLMFNDGEVVGTIVGALPKDALKEKIKNTFG
ncbi:MAG: thioredoxin [Nanoarchaeota archaeon]